MKNLLILALISSLFVVGCEKTEDDKMNKAQNCLDNARVPADAAGCSSIIDGIYNEKANRIRCSLSILENGTTQSEIIDAFKAMETGTQDPVIEISTVMGLGDMNSDTTVDSYETDIASDIKDICYQTDSVGLKTIAQIILFGTRAQAAVAIGDPENPADVANAVLLMSDADAGNFAIDVYDLYCEPTFSNEDFCNTLNSVGAADGDATTVGSALKTCLNANNCG